VGLTRAKKKKKKGHRMKVGRIGLVGDCGKPSAYRRGKIEWGSARGGGKGEIVSRGQNRKRRFETKKDDYKLRMGCKSPREGKGDLCGLGRVKGKDG